MNSRLDPKTKNIYQEYAQKLISISKKQVPPLFVGINGCQGSGKSTLAKFLSDTIKNDHDLKVLSVSLDDFYLSQQERQKLSHDIHPLLKTRGVPGTHNVELMKNTLEKLAQRQTNFKVPQFDKTSDNPFPESEWILIAEPIDIVIFDGWCWGIAPQNKTQLQKPVNQLEAERDKLGEWRNYINNQIQTHYQPLYRYFNHWLFLKAPSFDCVYKWRLEQEKHLASTANGDETSIMSAGEIRQFIQYFQRITEHALATFSEQADTTFYLDKKRQITLS